MSFLDIRTAVAQGAELLSKSSVPDPRLTAELLLCHALGARDRSYLFAHPEQELRQIEWLHYGRYLDQRMRGKPLQYITQKQEFFGREFRVTPDVLIPRPETELLAETVLKKVAQAFSLCEVNKSRAKLDLIDVGTGSGAIAVTLAIESDARVIATDISPAAIAVARTNAHRLHANVQFLCGDLLEPLAAESADIVVCNPPYVPESDRASLQREVREWEPAHALFAGERGLDIYARLFPQAHRVLKPGGVLAVEIGFGQADAVCSMAQNWSNPQVFADLAGIPRVLAFEKP